MMTYLLKNSATDFRLEPFFELSNDLLCIAGYDGYFKRINPAFAELLGYPYEELFAKPISDFIFDEDKNITAKYRENLIKGTPLLNYENRYITQSGEIVWLSWTSMPLTSENLVYAIAKNITHKKKLEEERNLLLANLTKINKELRQLNYKTSHDLRSPVNNLLSIFSLLDVSKIQDKETLEFIDFLKLATENLKKTLNDYVDQLSVKESLNVIIEEVNLHETLLAVRQSINSLIQHSKARFEIDFSEFENIRFNKAYLESIFLNIITNSIKYARPDCFPVISVFTKKVNGLKQLIFADNGLGFDMDQAKDKIFGLGQTFHNDSDSKGIGLYLVYNHVTSLGGHIEVESKINEGTKFIITFKD